MQNETFLVTGALGCLGAWVLKHLVDRGQRVIATDLGSDPVRPRLVMSNEALAKVIWRVLDVTDTKAVAATVADEGVTRIVHLAGLQIPFCRESPALGSAVNVTGTINLFEAARTFGVKGLAYASSLAALGPATDYDTWPLPDTAIPAPRTLYGAYKVANEQTAGIYAADWGVGSVGLRPCVVYGVGRDQGVTADFAKSVLASVAGRPFHIRTGGLIPMQHASDVARMFIGSADAGVTDAHVCNLRNDVIRTEDFIAALRQVIPSAKVTYDEGAEFPFPADLADDGLRAVLGKVPHTPLKDALSEDAAMYRYLIDCNAIDLGQLDV